MFKVGDKVRAFGCDGIVTNHRGVDADFPVIVDFGNEKVNSFTLEGKHYTWHKEPSLVLVERAEKFEEVVGYVPVYEYPELVAIGSAIYKTKEEAMKQKDAIGYQEVKYFRKV